MEPHSLSFTSYQLLHERRRSNACRHVHPKSTSSPSSMEAVRRSRRTVPSDGALKAYSPTRAGPIDTSFRGCQELITMISSDVERAQARRYPLAETCIVTFSDILSSWDRSKSASSAVPQKSRSTSAPTSNDFRAIVSTLYKGVVIRSLVLLAVLNVITE